MRYVQLFQLLILMMVVAVLGWIAYKLFGKGFLEGANWLKNSTPLGAPSRAIDSAITNATGRDETLGGILAEIFDPATREVAAIYGKPEQKPDTVDTELRRFGSVPLTPGQLMGWE